MTHRTIVATGITRAGRCDTGAGRGIDAQQRAYVVTR
jgi:hypothetical protein